MNKISISQGRKDLKALGYKLKAVANPFKFELKSLTIVSPNGREISLGSVMTADTYKEHEQALKIATTIEPNMSKAPNTKDSF